VSFERRRVPVLDARIVAMKSDGQGVSQLRFRPTEHAKRMSPNSDLCIEDQGSDGEELQMVSLEPCVRFARQNSLYTDKCRFAMGYLISASPNGPSDPSEERRKSN